MSGRRVGPRVLAAVVLFRNNNYREVKSDAGIQQVPLIGPRRQQTLNAPGPQRNRFRPEAPKVPQHRLIESLAPGRIPGALEKLRDAQKKLSTQLEQPTNSPAYVSRARLSGTQ
jgi:hypothetical protein